MYILKLLLDVHEVGDGQHILLPFNQRWGEGVHLAFMGKGGAGFRKQRM